VYLAAKNYSLADQWLHLTSLYSLNHSIDVLCICLTGFLPAPHYTTSTSSSPSLPPPLVLHLITKEIRHQCVWVSIYSFCINAATQISTTLTNFTFLSHHPVAIQHSSSSRFLNHHPTVTVYNVYICTIVPALPCGWSKRICELCIDDQSAHANGA